MGVTVIFKLDFNIKNQSVAINYLNQMINQNEFSEV